LLPMHSRPKLVLGFLLAALAAASMWFYVDQILVPYQKAESAAHGRPRGNLSDLYPRWLGARELLLRHRNPYSEDVTKQIQQGYYGRVLDPSRPDDPKDQQGFAYPVYVIFLLAPLIGFPWDEARMFFHWSLIILTAVSVWWWLRALRWRPSSISIASYLLLTLGSFPAVQGIKLQQLSLLVAALLAGSVACIAGGFLALGGALLALATIKPQLVLPLAAWMLLWALSDWSQRRRFASSFAVVMLLLLIVAEVVLPGWPGMFAHAVEQYRAYTQNQSVLNQLLPWAPLARLVAACAILATGLSIWKWRRQSAESQEFGCAVALVMALTVLIVPMYAPYNQVLLIPAILLLVRDRRSLISGSRAFRLIYAAGAVALAWQWIASFGLTAAYLAISPGWAMQHWRWPLFATFALPLCVFALVLIHAQRTIE
jgi:hypothetical protein